MKTIQKTRFSWKSKKKIYKNYPADKLSRLTLAFRLAQLTIFYTCSKAPEKALGWAMFSSHLGSTVEGLMTQLRPFSASFIRSKQRVKFGMNFLYLEEESCYGYVEEDVGYLVGSFHTNEQ